VELGAHGLGRCVELRRGAWHASPGPAAHGHASPGAPAEGHTARWRFVDLTQRARRAMRYTITVRNEPGLHRCLGGSDRQ